MDEYRVDIKVLEAYNDVVSDRSVYVAADTPHKAAGKAKSKLRRTYPDTWRHSFVVEKIEFVAHQFSFT